MATQTDEARAGTAAPATSAGAPPAGRARTISLRAVYLAGGLVLFIAALELMTTGAEGLVPVLAGSAVTDNAWSTLGLGWLGSCLVLSGSPIAASALSLLDGGAISWTQAFSMITGSRLGAAFVVLAAGTLYALRRSARGDRRPPVAIGVLAVFVTAIAYIPGSAAGLVLLQTGAVSMGGTNTPESAFSLTDAALGWVAPLAETVLPAPLLFPIGVAVLVLGFRVLDSGMPKVRDESLAAHEDAWYTRKWVMFGLGCAVCLLTLSVSVSLTVLVPLVASRRLRLTHAIPYIAGANITTLGDTLVAAGVIGNPHAVQVVAAITLGVAAWTVTMLAAAYPLVQRACLAVTTRVLATRRSLLAFCAVLLGAPLVLVAI